MAKSRQIKVVVDHTIKRTSQGRGKIKMSSMNKHKRRSLKAYNRQGSKR